MISLTVSASRARTNNLLDAGCWFRLFFVAMTQKDFYRSKAWQRCRAAKMESVSGLCEDCLDIGLIRPAEIVHHLVFLDDINVNNPSVSLNLDNLRAVCRDCHAARHKDDPHCGRYRVDPSGNIVRARE